MFVLQCYDKWLSLVSCIICVVVMFFIDWISSVVTIGVFFTLYLLVMYRQPGNLFLYKLLFSSFYVAYRYLRYENVKYPPHSCTYFDCKIIRNSLCLYAFSCELGLHHASPTV